MTVPSPLRTSVVIVTKDRPALLRTLLTALTVQSVPPDEVVVVDNASTESYAAVFSEFAARLPLKTVMEATPGIPAARNRGIRESTGDIIAFTDDDCEPDAAWLENLVKPFHRNPHIGAVGGELLPARRAGTLVEEFAATEMMTRVGRRDGAPA